MRFDKTNLIFIFVFIAIMSFIRGQNTIEETLLSLPGLIIALSLHEFAHARKAVKLGDPTPEMQGRYTISPLAHLDPVGTICLLFGGFGWGKPVEINPTNFKHPEKDGAKVAFAGPLMNFILSFIFAVLYGIFWVYIIKSGNYSISANMIGLKNGSVWAVLNDVLIRAMYLNLGLALFNLLPFPPLDGSKIYRAFLKGKAKEFLYNLENYSMIIIAIIFITGITSYILTPIISFIVNNVLWPIIQKIVELLV
ncbi:MAG: site-2 protease family protein [Clostridia bacterium]|nr:site-2 protease family protein [Clostridia bacterium]